MNSATPEAKQYLKPPGDGFWAWSEDGDAIAWINGITIVFRSELEQLLAPFVESGLPRLETILLLIAATRDNWPLRPTHLLRQVAGEDSKLKKKLEFALKLLESIHQLEPDVRLALPARRTLIETLVESAQSKLTAAAGKEVVRILRSHSDELFDGRHDSPTENCTISLRQSIRELGKAVGRVDAVQLRIRQSTGLDQPVLAADEDFDVRLPQTLKLLIAHWENDEQIGGMVHATKQLLPVVTLPRPIAERDTLAQGGVSDITNRGPLDRLLLSELAYDDLTLAVRVAVNEALYFRRESPPKSENRRRLILIDCGIRMWGVPRVFATSLALALAANGEPYAETTAFFADDNQIHPVDLRSRAGLIEQLGVIRHSMHVGDALPEFEEFADQVEGDVERIIITSAEAMADNEFGLALTQSQLLPLFAATVERDGQCTLLEISAKGRKCCQQAKIDIDKIAGPIPELIVGNTNASIPAIFSISPFPLLASQAGDLKRAWNLDSDRVIVITADHRMLLWTTPGRGGLQLSDRISRGELCWHSEGPSELHYAVTGSVQRGQFRLLRIDLTVVNGVTEIDLKIKPSEKYCSAGDSLFAVYSDRLMMIDKASGTAVTEFQLPPNRRHVHGRFFRDSNHWYALASGPISTQFESVAIPQRIRPSIEWMFECDEIEGPIGVTNKGQLFFTANEELTRPLLTPTQENVRCTFVGHGGNKIQLSAMQHVNKSQIVDVQLKQREDSHNFAPRLREREIMKQIHERPLRNRFAAVSILRSGCLALTSRKSQVFELKCQSSEIELRHIKGSQTDIDSMMHASFEPIDSPDGTGFRLSVAKFEDGSRVFLDSRGLLHLKSSNLAIPESTIALADMIQGGWSSDGSIWGNPYYLTAPSNVEAKQFFEATIQPFVEHCLKS